MSKKPIPRSILSQNVPRATLGHWRKIYPAPRTFGLSPIAHDWQLAVSRAFIDTFLGNMPSEICMRPSVCARLFVDPLDAPG